MVRQLWMNVLLLLSGSSSSGVHLVDAFTVSRPGAASSAVSSAPTKLSVFNNNNNGNMPDPERMKQIIQEESMNPENMKASAEMMKSMKPEDIDRMLREIDTMRPAEVEQMKAMGMNPDIMKQSLQMMKQNPEMVQQVSKMMDTMSPSELMEKSKQAQEQLQQMSNSNEQFSGAPSTAAAVDAVVEEDEEEEEEEEEDDDDDDDDAPIPEPDAKVLDALFQVGELMSVPPTGGVTLQAFMTLPPIPLLMGRDDESDLSRRELNECWADGSMGSTRVDRQGFERVWIEIQEYFEDELMEEARERSIKKTKKRRGAGKPKAERAVPMTPASAGGAPAVPQVGAELPAEVLEQQVKNMSDQDMDTMLSQMSEMTPEQEARMKAMGVDPAMMKKTAQMMKNNPMMKYAAKTMIKTMSPEQMKKASQQAQEQMKNMSEGDVQKLMDEMEKKTKQ